MIKCIADTLAASMGETITPKLIANIMLTASQFNRSPNKSLFTQYAYPIKRYLGYEIAAEGLSTCIKELAPLYQAQWDEIETTRPKLNVDYSRLLTTERDGKFLQLTVRDKWGTLVGGCGFFVYPAIQTSKLIAEESSLYLHPDHRKGLLAYFLAKHSHTCLQIVKVSEVILTVKAYANTGKLVERLGFKKTDTVYMKNMEDAYV